MCNDDSAFTDMNVHRLLRKKGIANPEGEWFRCTVKDIQAALLEIQSGVKNEENRTLYFAMRPEQSEAVDRTIAYFKRFKKENPDSQSPNKEEIIKQECYVLDFAPD